MLGWSALTAGEQAGPPAGGLSRSLLYLASRARVRTPIGAAEFMWSSCTHGRETYDKRVRIALDVCGLFRHYFPGEYERSPAPPFSTEREHEFYRLVEKNLFPLLFCQEVDLQTLCHSPQFFLPFIPMRGTQAHLWAGGCFDFQRIETVYKLAQVLSWMTGAGGDGWRALSMIFGLEGVPAPAPPLAAVGWTLFMYSCAVEDSPLKALPLAFSMISYKTGNPWLDLPQIGFVGFEWSREQIEALAAGWRRRQMMLDKMAELTHWLDEDPRPRISRAVELWNKASEVEARTGHAGHLVPHGQLFHTTLDGEVLADVYGETAGRIFPDPATQIAILTGEAFGAPPALPPAEQTEE